jgi:hypothetical protein
MNYYYRPSKTSKDTKKEPGVLVNACNPSTQEAKAGDQPGIQSKILFLKRKTGLAVYLKW